MIAPAIRAAARRRLVATGLKTDFRSPDPSLPYPITLYNADSASEECLATTTGPQPDESRFLFEQFGESLLDRKKRK